MDRALRRNWVLLAAAAIMLLPIPVENRHMLCIGAASPKFLVCVALSLVAGASASRLIEIPVLRIRDKVFPSHSNHSVASAS